jgi:hypothetical protein
MMTVDKMRNQQADHPYSRHLLESSARYRT